MLNIPDQPPPCVSTTLRSPQRHLNARRIRRDHVITFARTFAILALVAAVAVGIGALGLKASLNTTATAEQAHAMRAM